MCNADAFGAHVDEVRKSLSTGAATERTHRAALKDVLQPHSGLVAVQHLLRPVDVVARALPSDTQGTKPLIDGEPRPRAQTTQPCRIGRRVWLCWAI